jgi:glycerophosphoryl diester phosphodiesterase
LPELSKEFLRRPIAHRGLHDRARGVIENGRAAVSAAVEAGYAIEIDVQRSADGEAMVFHDAALRRLAGRPEQVEEMTAAELGAVELTGGGETIPTLGEILALVAGRAPLLVEVKDPDPGLGPVEGRLEARVAELLAGYGGEAAVMSFNPHSVAALAEAAPGLARGLTSCDFVGADWSLPDYRRAELAGLADFGRTGASFVSHNHRELDNPAVVRLRARGVPVVSWTIRSPAEEAAARRGSDNVTFEGYRPAVPRG